MEQHPVPQQISSYEFRLVGDMTLKQFAQLAGSCLLAFIFYVSPLPGYLKWPLVLFFVFLGFTLAFLPFEERPLHTWLMAFFKAIYSPTQFIWQKTPKKPEIFEEKALPFPQMPPLKVGFADQKKLSEYLATLPVSQSPLDQAEANLLSQIQNLFSFLPQPAKTEAVILPKEEVAQVIRAAGPWVTKEVIPQVVPYYTPPPPTIRPFQRREKAQFAKYTLEIPLPSIPEIPNVITGMVLDKEGKIMEGAIIEIRDVQGIPVRALRTNKLGQFRIATPLPNGAYEIETEKEGLEFDIIKIELKGEIVQPIEIKAKGQI